MGVVNKSSKVRCCIYTHTHTYIYRQTHSHRRAFKCNGANAENRQSTQTDSRQFIPDNLGHQSMAATPHRQPKRVRGERMEAVVALNDGCVA